jgi:hypothetical protein
MTAGEARLGVSIVLDVSALVREPLPESPGYDPGER